MRSIFLLGLALTAGCGDLASSNIRQIKRQVASCEAANIPYEIVLLPEHSAERRYCQRNNIPYRTESAHPTPSRKYSTRSERAARFNELGDKLHPTKAEEREYLRLYSEILTNP